MLQPSLDIRPHVLSFFGHHCIFTPSSKFIVYCYKDEQYIVLCTYSILDYVIEVPRGEGQDCQMAG